MGGLSTTQMTFRLEQFRAVSSGIIEAAASTFLLTIAVKWYEAGSVSKALLAAAGSCGLLLSPGVVWMTARSRYPTALVASRLFVVGAVGFLVAAAAPWLPLFVVGTSIGLIASSACVPLITQIYQENYPAQNRGRLLSGSFMIRIASAAIMSAVGGLALQDRMHLFPWLLAVFGLAMLFASACLRRCPSLPLLEDTGAHPLRGWRHVRSDPLFRQTLMSWMLMGFANLMMLPLRIEYLGNPKYGVAHDTFTLALLTGVIPHTARFVMSPIWGRLFDRMNFFVLRLMLNVGFALGILGFFTSSHRAGLILGSVFYGISNAGGDVAWSLWVTRFAPPDRVAEYMAVHTFLTGLRGVLAPAAAFYLIDRFAVGGLAVGCAMLIGIACLMLLPEVRSIRGRPVKSDVTQAIPDSND